MKDGRLQIGIDIGGVISKYPKIFWEMVSLMERGGADVYIVSDIHPREMIQEMLEMNGFSIKPERIIPADYNKHGEHCKAVVCKELQLDVMIDDHLAYMTPEGATVRLLVMPDGYRPYYAEEWKTSGKEGDFGRRTAVKPKH